MCKHPIFAATLLALVTLGCATTDDTAAVARAAVDTTLVAATMAGYGSLPPENCERYSSEYDRGVCIRRNSEIAAARAQANQPTPNADFEVGDSSDSRVVKFGVTR